jgi:hypothetical protein
MESPMEKVWNLIPYSDRHFSLFFQTLSEKNLAEQSGWRPEGSNPVTSSETMNNR